MRVRERNRRDRQINRETKNKRWKVRVGCVFACVIETDVLSKIGVLEVLNGYFTYVDKCPFYKTSSNKNI